ncbi:MAG: methyl-accepting chemotaxis protein [Marinomonas foliarum]|uniref:methyl-accepting chemotaxis protein n=1 Tax=Marinomonas foliarum TaxID=491950 RepID=UPI003F9AC4D7
MSNLSIRVKLVFLVGFFAMCLVGIVILASTQSIRSINEFASDELNQVQKDQAETLLMSTANEAQTKVRVFLESTASTVTNFASLLTQTAIGNSGEPFSRERVHAMTKGFVKSTPTMSALYAQFEKNGYDQLDSTSPKNTLTTSDVGTLDVYWVKEEGQFVSYETESAEKYGTEVDDNGIRESEWYLCSLESANACLLDPYLYEISEGNSVLMTSYTEPVLVNKKSVGLVGADVNLPKIQTEVTSLAQNLFDGQGQITIVSQRGIIVGSSAFPKAVGNNIKSTPLSGVDLTKKGLVEGELEWTFTSDFAIGHAAQNWTVFLSVPTSVLLAPSIKLNAGLSAKTNNAVTILLGLSLILVFIGLGVIYLIVRSVTAPLGDIASRMKELASEEGDLTQRLGQQKHLELVQLADGFNLFTEKLQKMVQQLNEQRHVVAHSNESFVDTTIQVDSSISSQTDQIQSVVTAVTEMSSSAFDVANLAQENGNATNEMSGYLKESLDLVQHNRSQVEHFASELNEASTQVAKVSERSDAIYSILDTIRAIAEQTNLLALNAAIEAARAGEQGRGFAVVADEVRSLAARTQDSTEEVDTLIKALQEDVGSAVNLINNSQSNISETVTVANNSAEKLGFVNDRVVTISENSSQVASAATEQSNVAEEINRNLVIISDAAQELRDVVSSLSSGHKNSVEAVNQLTNILSKLKV